MKTYMEPGEKYINFRVRDEMHKKIKLLAVTRENTIQDTITNILNDYMTKHESEHKRELIGDLS